MAEDKAPIVLQPGDVFVTRGPGVISRLIRYFSRNRGEEPTVVNHTGVIVTGGLLTEAVCVEAVSKVVQRPLWQAYGPPKKDEVAIFRPMNVTPEEIGLIVDEARGYVGKKYGYGKILAHLGDWALGGAYFFRRIAGFNNYPICSWVVAHAFKAAGKHFGVPPGAATPDDIWDFVNNNPDKYMCVLPLTQLSRVGS